MVTLHQFALEHGETIRMEKKYHTLMYTFSGLGSMEAILFFGVMERSMYIAMITADI